MDQEKKRPTARWGESGKAFVLVDALDVNTTIQGNESITNMETVL